MTLKGDMAELEVDSIKISDNEKVAPLRDNFGRTRFIIYSSYNGYIRFLRESRPQYIQDKDFSRMRKDFVRRYNASCSN